MGISNVQFKDLIQASPLVGKKLKLTEGQVVSGKILNISEKGAVISLAGSKILAQTSLNLHEGSSIKARIEVISGDKIVLRLLEQKSDTPFTFQTLEDTDIENVLLKLGAAGEPRAMTAAKALLSVAVAVSSENIEKMLVAMQKLNIENLPEAKALAFLISRNIPLNRTTLELAVSLFSSAKLGELMGDAGSKLAAVSQMEPFKQLITQLNNLSSVLKFDNPVVLEASLKAALKSMSFDLPMLASLQKGLTPDEVVAAAKSLANEGQQLIQSVDRHAVKQIGLSAKVLQEAGLLLSNMGKQAPVSTDTVNRLMDILPQIIAKTSNLNPNLADKLSGVLFKLGMFAKLISPVPDAALRISINDSLVNSQDILKSIFLGDNKTINQLSDSLGKVAANISAQQMFSSSADIAPAPLNIMYLQVPFSIDNQVRTLEIAIKGDETQAKKIDPENTSVNLFLAMPNLGNLGIHLKIDDGNLSGRFMVESQEAKNAIDMKVDRLNQSLGNVVKGSIAIDSMVRASNSDGQSVEEILMPVESRKMDMYI